MKQKEKNIIVLTIEKIERFNKAIAFHQSFESPDRLAIQQYCDKKEAVAKFLFDYLLSLDLKKELQHYALEMAA